MSPGNGESGYGSSGSDNRDSSHGNRNVGFVPASADTTSRRRNMNIEDMLNPSDESTIRHQQPQSSNSYEAGGTVSRNPHSLQGSRVPRSGRHSHGVNASAGSRQGSHPPSVRRSRGSRTPDVPPRTRGFRPAYSTEEGHFIWYLRLDCGYAWTAIADAYNARFSQNGQGQRAIPGLECKFYRITKAHGLPNVRAMRRTRDIVQRCAMRANTGYTQEKWAWLDGRYPPSTAYGHWLGDETRADKEAG